MFLQHFYSAQSVESSILVADNDDCLCGDLYDVLKALDCEEEVLLMAPGCLSKNQQQAEMVAPYFKNSSSESSDEINLDQIPLPSTPPPSIHDNDDDQRNDFDDDESDAEETLESLGVPATVAAIPVSPPRKPFIYDHTLDSFEILEQTVRKQKRLAKKKNTDMRVKVLLKRTFDLVCEIMDHENGFDDDDDVVNEKINVAKKPSPPPPLPVSVLPSAEDLYKSASSNVVLEVNVKHNDYADEDKNYNNYSGDLNNVVPAAAVKRTHDDDDNDDEEEEDNENRAAPNEDPKRRSKRQKFTSEMASGADSNGNWCKDENESMWFDKCACADSNKQNSVFYQNDKPPQQQLFSSEL